MRLTVDGDAELGRWEWEEQLNMLPSHTIQYFLMHTVSRYVLLHRAPVFQRKCYFLASLVFYDIPETECFRFDVVLVA